MTKIWQLRVLTTYLTLGVPLAVSCAREANTLEGDDDTTSSAGTKTSGGSTGNAGASSTAGATSKAGATSAFGGTASMGGTGGSGTAGTKTTGGDSATTAGAAAGGKAGAGGASGSASGGAGGTATTIPPEVLARAQAIVLYQTAHATAMDGTIQMKLFIQNQSADPLPMANVKIRYWFTAEVATELHQYYTGAEAKTPKAVFVNDGANSHALLTFGGGSVVKGGDINATEIQLEISNNTGKFNQADDFSWQPTSSTSKANDKITLYLDDTLIWGCEPGGKCFDDGAGGQGAGGAP